MGKFSTGLFAGTVIGVGMSMLDKRTLRRAKRMARHMMSEISHICM